MMREVCICETPMRWPIVVGEVLLEVQAQHLALARGDRACSWASVARSSARSKPCSVLATVSASVSPVAFPPACGVSSDVAR